MGSLAKIHGKPVSRQSRRGRQPANRLAPSKETRRERRAKRQQQQLQARMSEDSAKELKQPLKEYHATVSMGGKKYSLGVFASKDDASSAYKKAGAMKKKGTLRAYLASGGVFGTSPRAQQKEAAEKQRRLRARRPTGMFNRGSKPLLDHQSSESSVMEV